MKSQNCKFEVFFKNDKGFGLRLLEPLKKGRFITEFPEASSSYEDLSDITDQWLTQGLWNVVQDKTTIQDTKQLGGIMSKYISHSNEANCVVQKWQVGELIMTGLYAKRDIEQNEELFLDYTVPYTGHGIIDPKPDPLIATDKNFSDNLGKPIENADDITNDIIILGFFIEALGLDVLRDLLKGDPPNLVTIKKILEILKKLPCDRKYLKFYNDSKIKETLIKLAPKIVQFNDLFQHVNNIDTQGLFYENVLLVGGNSLFSGYKERIEKDLRVLAPSDYEIKIGIPDNPITYAWHGGSKFAKTNEFKDMSVTKSEYDEHGSNICLKKFDGRRKTRLGEAKPYDTLTNKEVKLILDHNFCSPNNLTGLLYLSDQGGIERRQTSRVIFKELLIEVESPRIDLDGSKAWIK
ncbi:6940_t:CDS:10, partial [Entrophospora sp. SA101]